MYENTIPQMIKMLGATQKNFDKLEQHATAKKYDANVMLQTRLAPDMYPFVKQIQAACDSAKAAGARLQGQTPPVHEDNETTLEQLRARVDKTIAYLKTVKPESFKGAEERAIDIPWAPGKFMRGAAWARELTVPNFTFHLAMAYAILRTNGVDVGKTDFLGDIPLQDKK